MTNLEFQQIKKEQLPALLELEKACTGDGEDLHDITLRFIANPNLFMGCFDGDEMVGEISGFVRKGKVIIKSVYVKAGHQGQGIGKRLLMFFESRARKRGRIFSVAVEVGFGEAFFSRNGYRPKEILLQVKTEDLPEGYHDTDFRVIEEREEDGITYIYFRTEKSDRQFLDHLKEKFNAFEANFIYEKDNFLY